MKVRDGLPLCLNRFLLRASNLSSKKVNKVKVIRPDFHVHYVPPRRVMIHNIVFEIKADDKQQIEV